MCMHVGVSVCSVWACTPHAFVCMYLCKCECAGVWAYALIDVHERALAHEHVALRVCICACMYAREYVRTYAHMMYTHKLVCR